MREDDFDASRKWAYHFEKCPLTFTVYYNLSDMRAFYQCANSLSREPRIKGDVGMPTQKGGDNASVRDHRTSAKNAGVGAVFARNGLKSGSE